MIKLLKIISFFRIDREQEPRERRSDLALYRKECALTRTNLPGCGRRPRFWLFVAPMLMLMLLWILPDSSQAQEFVRDGGNLKVGVLQVHPSLELRETYSSNTYLNYGGLPSDPGFITTITPGIKLLLPVSNHEFFAEYLADFNFYSVDSNTNYVQQKAGGGAKFKFARDLDASLTYYYLDSEVPRTGKTGQTDPGVPDDYFRARPYNQNDFKGLIGWSFADRWRLEGFFNFLNYRYKNSIDFYNNYDQPMYGGRIFYRLSPKVSVLGEYNYQPITYPDDKIYDNTNQFIYLGLAFDPTARLNGELKIGYEDKNYDQTVAGQNRNFKGTAIDGNLAYKLNTNSTLRLLLNRSINDDQTTNAPYTQNRVGLEWRHFWSRNTKVSGTLRGGYGTLDFDAPTFDADGSFKKRDDRRWEFGVGLGYDLRRWLTMSLGYGYVNNQSNFINYDYQENRVYFNILASF
jgi:polysaccharide biosynthesis protein VpsM